MAEISLHKKIPKRIESDNGKYLLHIINKPSDTAYLIPLLWATAKTYYETYGEHREDWKWAVPRYDYSDPVALAKQLVMSNPKAVGFSVYMWNEKFNIKTAQTIKELDPTCVILWGGPQCNVEFNKDFFREHPFIDVVVPGDAYGEVSFCDILDNISGGDGTLVKENLSYVYYPGANNDVMFNSRGPKKKDFQWPENPFRAQEKYIKPFIDELHANDNQVRLMIETSRGCPYGCTFCDWGGGTYTKTIKKPMQTVLDEIAWCGENKIDFISVTDANFGIFEIDIDYARHFAKTKQKYGYPKSLHLNGPTKVKLKNLMKIYEILAEASMIGHYQISIQDINEDIKKNVNRIDFSFADQVAMFRELQSIKSLPIFVECILGLPGATVETMKNGIDEILQAGLQYPIHYLWSMLPATPANDPDYKEKYKLVTVKGKSSEPIGPPHVLAAKPGVKPDPNLYLLDDNLEIDVEFVVGTFSYTKEEFVEMTMLMIFTGQITGSKFLTLIYNYLYTEHGINYGDFLHACLTTILNDKDVDRELQNNYNIVKNHFNNWLHTDAIDAYIDPGPEWNFRMSPVIFLNYVSLLDTRPFFDAIKKTISKMIPLDDKIEDLIKFSRERMLEFNHIKQRTFTVEYDWLKYEEQGILDKNQTTYQIADEEVFTGGQYFGLDWLEHEGIRRHKEFIYKFCYDFRSTKAARKLIRTNR